MGYNGDLRTKYGDVSWDFCEIYSRAYDTVVGFARKWSILMFNMENHQRPLNLGQHLLFGVWLGTDCWWLGLEEILQESPLLLPPNEGHFAGTNSGIRKISRTTTKDRQYNLQNGYGVCNKLPMFMDLPTMWGNNHDWVQLFFSNQGNHKLCLSKHGGA